MDATYALRQTILGQLQSGQWQAGARLPTEREFCEQFQISRTTVRKVLGELKSAGWLKQTVGSGTYVSERAPLAAPANGSSGLRQGVSPAELMQARLAIEPAIVDLVIGNGTVGDFDHMRLCCDRAEAATTHEEFEHWDAQFHEAIARAAHNSLVTNIFQMMNDARAQGEWGALKKKSLTPERRLAYQREHRELLNALRERDPGRARATATEHLLGIRRNLLNY
ncbi:FadR family transcriptional regulator [Ottowia sp. GY511]|uniref:FadR/GntR family transcriptional regulator n=1 Tax=Ottowia flava TaxID=2675430 RepID=A0ABW4KPM8_9BURK|nr:FCD domain-containing protein [Ottowia sp. GY511]TXK24697.1 FadR family transcriptional regulator [Ottowia sp. GY511]